MSPAPNRQSRRQGSRSGPGRTGPKGGRLPKFTPVETHETPVDEQEMITVLTHTDGSGQKREFQVPADPQAGLGLKYLEDAAAFGAEWAGYELVKAMMGEENFEEITNLRGLPQSALDQVVENCVAISQGYLEDGEGKAGDDD
jgi:hypothetical protein